MFYPGLSYNSVSLESGFFFFGSDDSGPCPRSHSSGWAGHRWQGSHPAVTGDGLALEVLAAFLRPCWTFPQGPKVLPVSLSLDRVLISLFSIPVTTGCCAPHSSLFWLLGPHSLGARLRTFSPLPLCPTALPSLGPLCVWGQRTLQSKPGAVGPVGG